MPELLELFTAPPVKVETADGYIMSDGRLASRDANGNQAFSVTWDESKHPRNKSGEWTAGATESASSVIERVKASPNQPEDRNWERYADQFGIDGDFHHVEIPTDHLVKNLNSGHLRRSNTLNQDTVIKKIKSGDRNPVIITQEPGRQHLVVDGNHSLQAAINNGDKHVQAIVSKKSGLASQFAKEKNPWDMTQDEVDALSYDDFEAADKAISKKWAELVSKDRTDEEDHTLAQITKVSDYLHDAAEKHKAEKAKQQNAAATHIESGKPWMATRGQFLDYHKTGTISDSAYDRMTGTEGGMSYIRPGDFNENHGEHEVNGKKVQIKIKREKNKYVKHDDNDDIMRDEKGDAIMMTDKEIEKAGLPAQAVTVAAFDDGKPVGYSGDEFGATGVYVANTHHKHGLGVKLLDTYMRESGRLQNGMKIGQMTSAGRSVVRAWHKKLVSDALKAGEKVPPAVLQEYPEL